MYIQSHQSDKIAVTRVKRKHKGLAFVLITLSSCSPQNIKTSQSAQIKQEQPLKQTALSSTQRQNLYYRSQGIENIPYFIARILKVTAPNGEELGFLSRANLERYGFLFPNSQENLPGPDGLPIGMTLRRSAVYGTVSMGTNCAACHVGEIHYTFTDGSGQQRFPALRLDGGVNYLDISKFYMDLYSSLVKRFTTLNPVSQAQTLIELNNSYNYVKNNLQSISGGDPDFNLSITAIPRFLLFLISNANLLQEVLTNPNEFPSYEKMRTVATLFPFDDDVPDLSLKRKLVVANIYYALLSLKVMRSGNGEHGFGRTNPFAQIKNMMHGHQDFWQESKWGSISYPPPLSP